MLSAIGESPDAGWAAFAGVAGGKLAANSELFNPHAFYPIVPCDYRKHIPRRSQRVMGPMMLYATYAAGLALDDARLTGSAGLEETDVIVACGTGERDLEQDLEIADRVLTSENPDAELGFAMGEIFRPTRFLSQLPNMTAANIAKTYGITRSSRTLLGEDSAGAMAVRMAHDRIASGEASVVLVGGADFAACPYTMMALADAGQLLEGPVGGVWTRGGGGICLGSAGAFLVLESEEHARARHASIRAYLEAIDSWWDPSLEGIKGSSVDWTEFDEWIRPGRFGVVSGTCGVRDRADAELDALNTKRKDWGDFPIRGVGMALGFSREASLFCSLNVAIWCLDRRRMFPPLSVEGRIETPFDGMLDQMLVTGWGALAADSAAVVTGAGI